MKIIHIIGAMIDVSMRRDDSKVIKLSCRDLSNIVNPDRPVCISSITEPVIHDYPKYIKKPQRPTHISVNLHLQYLIYLNLKNE